MYTKRKLPSIQHSKIRRFAVAVLAGILAGRRPGTRALVQLQLQIKPRYSGCPQDARLGPVGRDAATSSPSF